MLPNASCVPAPFTVLGRGPLFGTESAHPLVRHRVGTETSEPTGLDAQYAEPAQMMPCASVTAGDPLLRRVHHLPSNVSSTGCFVADADCAGTLASRSGAPRRLSVTR